MIEWTPARVRWAQYLAAPLVSAVVVMVVLRPWEYPGSYVFTSGNDWVWQQAAFQMHADGGPWGAVDSLSWPIGANVWRLPQWGLGAGLFAWVAVGWFGVGTAAGVLWFVVLAAAVNAAAMVVLLRRVGGAKLGPLTVAIAVALSATVFHVTHQINLGLFAVFPVVFAVLVSVTGRSTGPAQLRRTGVEVVLVAVVAVLSPLWWVSVLVLAIPFVALPLAFRRRWGGVVAVGAVWAAIAAAGLVQAGLHLVAARGGPGADVSRTPWLSNYFSGHMTDLLIGSPIVERIAPDIVERLRPGASVAVGFGLPLIAAALVSVVAVVARAPRRSRSGVDLTALGALTVVFLLFWLGGGLGNLQAAGAVILDTVSPARGWFRMVIPLAVLGAAWVTVALEPPALPDRVGRPRTWLVVPGALMVGALAIADLFLLAPRQEWTAPQAPQHDRAAIEFIRERTEPCPVAQFPHEALPGGVITTGIADNRMYRGLVPYVIAPEYQWTAGSRQPDGQHVDDALAGVAEDASDADLDTLASRGVCAVVYDRLLGALATEQMAAVAGRSIAATRPADYEDDRYVVYLLRR